MNSSLFQKSHALNTEGCEESLPENGDYSALAKVQRIALYVFFFSINFEVWDPFNTDGFFSIAKLAGLIYLLTILPRIYYFIRTDSLQSVMRPIWLYFGLLTLIDCLNLTEMSGEFFDLSLFQNIFLLWFLLNHERKDTLVLEKGMLCFALGSFAMALLNSAGIGTDYVLNRVMIFGDNPNIIGLRMSVSMSILVLTIVQNKLKFGKLRYLLIVPLPLMLKLLIETASRVALISFILTFLVGVVLFKTKRVMGKIAVLILGAVLSIYGWLALQESELIVKRLLETYYKGDLAGRDIFWETLLPLIESNPLFGVGKIGYEAFCQRAIGFLFSPHNVFLEVLCYTGFVGLSLYVTFLYQVSKRGYESYKTEGLLLPLLLLIPVAGMILSGQILTTKIGWCIFAYVSATPLLKPKSELAGGVDMVKKHDDSL